MIIKKITQFLGIATIGISLSLISACGNSAVKEMESLADDACACKDMECLAKVKQRIVKAAEKLKDAKGTEADGKKLMEAMGRVTSCSTKLAASAPK